MGAETLHLFAARLNKSDPCLRADQAPGQAFSGVYLQQQQRLKSASTFRTARLMSTGQSQQLFNKYNQGAFMISQDCSGSK